MIAFELCDCFNGMMIDLERSCSRNPMFDNPPVVVSETFHEAFNHSRTHLVGPEITKVIDSSSLDNDNSVTHPVSDYRMEIIEGKGRNESWIFQLRLNLGAGSCQ